MHGLRCERSRRLIATPRLRREIATAIVSEERDAATSAAPFDELSSVGAIGFCFRPSGLLFGQGYDPSRSCLAGPLRLLAASPVVF